MEGMDLVTTGLRWLHMLAAIALGGGLIYQRVALVPIAGELTDTAKERARRGWAIVVMVSILFLLVSGLTNLILTIKAYKVYSPGLEGSYHMLFGIKFLLGLALFFFASILAGRSDNAKKFQANAKRWLNVSLLLLVIIVCLSGVLRNLREKVLIENIEHAKTTDTTTG